MTRNFLTYAATFIALAALDFLWLGAVARNFYREGIGHLMASSVNIGAAAAFYLLYPIGLVVFAVLPSGGDWLRTLSPVLRTFILATIAVPIVIYGLMPHLHRLRARLLGR